ncbi:hypothetical protein HDE_06761 [Halotydeus destructor]|nr:hypothetical protein HDE_06761 [Halotydeus destructor]
MCVFAYNSSRQASTKYSPYYLMFGREPLTPVQVTLEVPKIGSKNPATYAEVLHKHMELIRDLAKENLEKVQHETVSRYNERHRPVEFQVGDLVLVHFPTRIRQRATKLLHPWHGPYTVCAKISPLTYMVTLKNGKSRRKETVNISRMKPFYERNVSSSSETEEEQELNYHTPQEIESESEPESSTPMTTAANVTLTEPITQTSSEVHDEVPIEERDSSATEIMDGSDSATEIASGAGKDSASGEISPIVASDESTSTSGTASELETTLVPGGAERLVGQPTASTPTREEPIVPSLRRGTRKRKRPSALDAFIPMCTLVAACEASFNRVTPVVWKPSHERLVNGMNSVVAFVKYDDPCEIFRQLPVSIYSESVKENFVTWCIKAFENDVLTPLTTFCEDVDDMKHTAIRKTLHRPKRFVVAASILLGVLATIGVSAFTAYVGYVNHEELKNEMKQLSRKLDYLEKNVTIANQVIQQLEDKLKDLGYAVNENRKHINKLEASMPQAVIIVSHLTSQLTQAKDKLFYAARKWNRDKQVDQVLLDFFNITLPCEENCPTDRAVAKKCTLDRRRSLLKIEFEVTLINPDVSTLRADPFLQLNYNSASSQVCYNKYTGPKFVMVDKKRNHCIMPLADSSVDMYGYIATPSTSHCMGLGTSEAAPKYWARDRCIDVHHLHPTERTQIKLSGDNMVIYCPRRRITIHAVNISCPDYVFSLPKTVSFRIDEYQYNASSSTTEVTENIESDLIHKLNFILDAPLPEITLDLNKTEDLIHSLGMNTETGSSTVDLPVFSRSVVLTLSVVFFVWLCWVCAPWRKVGPKPRHYVEMDMSDGTPMATIHRQTSRRYECPKDILEPSEDAGIQV